MRRPLEVVRHAIEAWLGDVDADARLWTVYPTAVLLTSETLGAARDMFEAAAPDFLIPSSATHTLWSVASVWQQEDCWSPMNHSRFGPGPRTWSLPSMTPASSMSERLRPGGSSRRSRAAESSLRTASRERGRHR
jgi:hypothetical protein